MARRLLFHRVDASLFHGQSVLRVDKLLPDRPVAVLNPARWRSDFSPRSFYPRVGSLLPWLFAGALVSCAIGFYVGFFLVPIDAARGETYRIIYIHVPATWMSLLIFLLIAFWAGVGLFFRAPLAAMMAQALVPTGTTFAFMVLWTGALWGKPVWGSWWVWDLRLVAELIILLLYLAMLAVQTWVEDARLADRLSAGLALLGVAIVPAILVSVVFWPSGHPNAAGVPTGTVGGPFNTLTALVAVATGFWLYGSGMALVRLRCVILERERQSDWVSAYGAGRR